MAPYARPAPLFEHEPCPHCHGSGRASPKGGKRETPCDRCRGNGWVYTPRGRAADEYYDARAHYRKPVEEVGPGEDVLDPLSNRYLGVAAVVPTEQDLVLDCMTFAGRLKIHVPARTIVQCRRDRTTRRAARDDARAYQATLSRTGAVVKRAAG